MTDKSSLQRFGVSMEGDLLDAFDELIERKGYANRSEAIRDLVRASLVEADWSDPQKPAVGALCMVYDHHQPDLAARLTGLQHEYADRVVSTMHVHLDAHDCLEVIVLRGRAAELRELADRIIATRGVKHGKLMVTTAGHDHADHHHHHPKKRR